jgi:prepilin-type N-terminal cleavage/methylation domain-containing protein
MKIKFCDNVKLFIAFCFCADKWIIKKLRYMMEEKGMTLVELLIIIAILSIIAAIAIPMLQAHHYTWRW